MVAFLPEGVLASMPESRSSASEAPQTVTNAEVTGSGEAEAAELRSFCDSQEMQGEEQPSFDS